uniref:DUF834 domain-containing protein n=1 Tax=Oryza meridionalis TaxID=40149 RepID=A0A0E0DBZ3_9ORYZ
MSRRRKETTLGQDEPDSRRRERAATLMTTAPVVGAPRHLRRAGRGRSNGLGRARCGIFGCRTMRALDSLATAALSNWLAAVAVTRRSRGLDGAVEYGLTAVAAEHGVGALGDGQWAPVDGVNGVDAVAGAAVDVVWEALIIAEVEAAGDAERWRQRGGMENAMEWHGSNLPKL